MKKRRIQINPVPDEVYDDVTDNPQAIFGLLDDLKIEIPASSVFMLACLKVTSPKLDIRLYANQNEYLTAYTRIILKCRTDYNFYSFRKDDGVDIWELFLPPPVIGLGLQTRLRAGIDQQ